MAEVLPSSFRFNNTETVDTGFSALLIANLFKLNTFKAGITFTNKYTIKAGQIYIRRLGKIAATLAKATEAGGLDFTHTETRDSLVLIKVDDVVKVSEKIYSAISELRASGKSADKMNEVIAAFREKLQIVWASYLTKPTAAVGQVEIGGAARSANTDIIKDYEALKASILADRKQIIVNGGMPDTLIINPDMEELILSQAGKSGNAFTPARNEELVKEGIIRQWFGLNVIVSNLYGTGVPMKLPVDGNALANSGDAANTQYVVYDHEAFGIALTIETIRLKEDDGSFVGSFGQCFGVTGGGVSNPALAYACVAAEII